ncbi:MAG: hypothetical protein V7727_02160 [Sneathiella sp.]
MTIKKYRPSNGSEGDWFFGTYCQHCVREAGNKNCSIFGRTLFHGIEEKEYPSEWRYDEDDNPICTAFNDRDKAKQKRVVKQKPVDDLPMFRGAAE